MSRKKKSSKHNASPAVNHASKSSHSSKPKSVNWRKMGERLFFGLALMGIVGIAVAAYMGKVSEDQDLSVIGNGMSTVVQIHDPGCRLCQQLKRNLDSVKGEFKDNIQFKTANINTRQGREFSRQHNVQHVTLLFFDEGGRHIETIEGVTPPQAIKTELSKLVSR